MSDYYKSYRELKATAKTILEKEKTIAGILPIDIDLLAEKSGFDIIPTPNFKESIAKEAFLSPLSKEIFVDFELMNNPKLENRYRFAIAHEIAHYFLHLDYYESKIGNVTSIEEWVQEYRNIPETELSLFEYQANTVAGCILIPDMHLDQYFWSVLEIFSPQIMEAKENQIDRNTYIDYVKSAISSKLAPKFYVSTIAMEIRLKDLKYAEQIP